MPASQSDRPAWTRALRRALHNPDPGPARAQAGEADPDLFFTDQPRAGARGQRNREYVSLFADEAPRALSGRSPLECYGDLMRAFRDAFAVELGGLVEEVVVGAGPCGELRFPSYPEANGWRFPGVRRAARGPAAPRPARSGAATDKSARVVLISRPAAALQAYVWSGIRSGSGAGECRLRTGAG